MLERPQREAVQEIAISEFKAKWLAVIERVRSTKKPIRITRFGKPVAEVVPPTAVEDRKARIGSMKDTFEIRGDIVSPATHEDEWEVLRDSDCCLTHTSGCGIFKIRGDSGGASCILSRTRKTNSGSPPSAPGKRLRSITKAGFASRKT